MDPKGEKMAGRGRVVGPWRDSPRSDRLTLDKCLVREVSSVCVWNGAAVWGKAHAFVNSNCDTRT